MSSEMTNWQKIAERGAVSKVALSKRLIKIHNLDLDLALRIGHALTLELDKLSDWPMYDDFTLERAQAEAQEMLAKRYEREVFGETRPANRNCAVRVERWSPGIFELTADVRNDFEDHPELEGGAKLQAAFVAAIEGLEL